MVFWNHIILSGVDVGIFLLPTSSKIAAASVKQFVCFANSM